MKIRNVFTAILLAVGIVLVFLLVTAAVAVGQARLQPPAPPIATALIPFDFWIGNTHLAAGEYALYPVLRLNTLVLLRNTKTNAQEQVFLVPTGEQARSGEYKLIFVVHTGQHYLQELWESDGKAVVTSQIGITTAPSDTRMDVPLNREKAVQARATAE